MIGSIREERAVEVRERTLATIAITAAEAITSEEETMATISGTVILETDGITEIPEIPEITTIDRRQTTNIAIREITMANNIATTGTIIEAKAVTITEVATVTEITATTDPTVTERIGARTENNATTMEVAAIESIRQIIGRTSTKNVNIRM